LHSAASSAAATTSAPYPSPGWCPGNSPNTRASGFQVQPLMSIASAIAPIQMSPALPIAISKLLAACRASSFARCHGAIVSGASSSISSISSGANHERPCATNCTSAGADAIDSG